MEMQQQVRVWRKEDVLDLLATSDKAVVRAIKGLYARQTADEQSAKTTRVANGQGFNANDARFLSDIAVKLPRYSDNMTARQLFVARKMLRKYWRQLLEMIQENGGVVEFPKARKKEIANSVEEDAYEVEASEALNADPLPASEMSGSMSVRWGAF